MDSLKNILVLDIETVSGSTSFDNLSPNLQLLWGKKAAFLKNDQNLQPAELYFDRAAIYAEFGKIIVIALGFFHQTEEGWSLRVKSFEDHEEKKLLSEFSDFIGSKFDPEKLTLCAHNGKEFDFPYLCRRMLVNEISIPKALDFAGKKPWEIQHMDTMEMWKFGDRKSFTSLDLLTEIFGIDSSKDEMDGSQVNTVYYREGGLEKIADYCRKDVIATAQLYLRLASLKPIPSPRIVIVE